MHYMILLSRNDYNVHEFRSPVHPLHPLVVSSNGKNYSLQYFSMPCCLANLPSTESLVNFGPNTQLAAPLSFLYSRCSVQHVSLEHALRCADMPLAIDRFSHNRDSAYQAHSIRPIENRKTSAPSRLRTYLPVAEFNLEP
jgi:hypothetical protein